MKIRSLRRIRFWSRPVLAVGILAFLFIEYAWPALVLRTHSEEYQRLVVECDNAMHDEVALRDYRGDKAKLLHTSADVALLVCHHYDKLRKKLLVAGVTDDELSLLGLEALEHQKISVMRMVEPHRMPRF